jgi:putative peptidoglycan lipid II flippase
MSVAKSSMIMASGTILSRILGFVRAVMLAGVIGVTTNAADAFGVANQLPNNVYAIIVGGVLNAVLVPQIVRSKSHADGGKGYIDRLLTLAILVFGVVTLVATIASPLLIHLYTHGWSNNQLALATAFAYWCLPQLFFYGLYSMLGEVLNARSAFGPYMWAPVVNNIVSISGLGFYIFLFGVDPTGKQNISDWGSGQITLLAISATLGVAAQAVILFISWRRIGLHYSPNFKFRGFGLRPALKAAIWTLAMVIVTQIGGLVQTAVASITVSHRTDNTVGVASIAAMGIAWLIFMLPHSVATVSIATAYFTKISTHAHEGRIDLVKADLVTALRLISVISVLSTAVLLVLAFPFSRVFVGEFEGLIALGYVVMAFVIGLVPFSFVFMMQKAFYALEDTKSPFWFTVGQTVLYIVGALIMGATLPLEWLVAGLALLMSFTVLVQARVAYVLLGRRIGSLKSFKITSLNLRAISAGLVAAAAGIGVLQLFGGIHDQSFAVATVVSSLFTSAVVGAVMAVVYLAVLILLKVDEAKSAIQTAKGILRR